MQDIYYKKRLRLLINIETANPPNKVSQALATEELKKRMSVRPAIGRMIDSASIHSGINSRYFVVADANTANGEKFYSKDGEYIKPGTEARMIQYERWSKILTKEAVGKLFEKDGIAPAEINRLITISCTGFFAPGLDYFLMNEFGIPVSAKRTNIGFMGCAASLIGFNSILESLNTSDAIEINALMVSVELCSLHLQTEPSRDNILANMIFADGAGAALFTNSKHHKDKVKLDLIFTESFLLKNSASFMGWKIGNYGFEMMLSSDLPKIILEKAVPQLVNILQSHGIRPDEVSSWALHPGGRAILDSLQNGLNLSDEKMKPSRTVLKNYGNMSSASILFVLKEIISLNQIMENAYCCAVAFGPGLTMEVSVFKGAKCF